MNKTAIRPYWNRNRSRCQLIEKNNEQIICLYNMTFWYFNFYSAKNKLGKYKPNSLILILKDSLTKQRIALIMNRSRCDYNNAESKKYPKKLVLFRKMNVDEQTSNKMSRIQLSKKGNPYRHRKPEEAIVSIEKSKKFT